MSLVLEWIEDMSLLLENPHVKSLKAAKIKKYRETDPNVQEYNQIKKELYKGQKGNSEAMKKGWETRKKNDPEGKSSKRAAKTREKWYKDENNHQEFMKKIKQRNNQTNKKKTK